MIRYVLILLAVALPLLLIAWWMRRNPPAKSSRYDQIGPDLLKSRNGWIEDLGHLMSILGPIGAWPLLKIESELENEFWIAGVALGLMAIIPIAVFRIATASGGRERWFEFWRYYELNWGVSAKSLWWLYLFFALIGLVSAGGIITELL